jgi:hypothetical protein
VEIDWAVVGSLLAGFGSLLTGIATYRLAKRANGGSKARRDDHDGERPGGD